MNTENLINKQDHISRAGGVIWAWIWKSTPKLFAWGGLLTILWLFVAGLLAGEVRKIHHTENEQVVDMLDSAYYTVMALNLKIDSYLKSQKADSIISDVNKKIESVKRVDKTRKNVSGKRTSLD